MKALFIILYINLFRIDSFLLSNICINKNHNLYKLNMLYDKDFAEAISKPSIFTEDKKNEHKSDYINHQNNITKEINNPINFVLPGFFEVFPELNFNWIEWLKAIKEDKNNCNTDEDCYYPTVCCPNPIVPTNKFCCNGHYIKQTYNPLYMRDEIKLAIN